jgi:hypothetical protein
MIVPRSWKVFSPRVAWPPPRGHARQPRHWLFLPVEALAANGRTCYLGGGNVVTTVCYVMGREEGGYLYRMVGYGRISVDMVWYARVEGAGLAPVPRYPGWPPLVVFGSSYPSSAWYNSCEGECSGCC